MKISLIGMSGSGKTYWSKKLEEKGFKRFCCDDLIEEKLGKELKHLGYSGIAGVSRWMGQPYDKQYEQTSNQYLDFEKEVMNQVLSFVEKADENENIVIDTTGSVIYTGDEILKKLTKLTKVIYLETPASVKEEMYQLYLKDPKPVIWGESFNKQNNESDMDALARCYPELLAFRTKQYEKLSDITLDYHMLRKSDTTLEKFIKLISND